jgi:hypothetical protein
MSGQRTTRRSFIGVAGAALSAPLAAAGPALATAARPVDDLGAIRALAQAYARHVNAGDVEQPRALFADAAAAAADLGIRRVTSDAFGEHDTITVAADGQSATVVLHCTVDLENAIGPECPLLDMARQQGGGVLRRTERGVFEHTCVKQDGVWKILRAGYRGRVTG